MVTLKYDLTEIRGAIAVSPEDMRFGKTMRLLGAGRPFKPYGYFSNASWEVSRIRYGLAKNGSGYILR